MKNIILLFVLIVGSSIPVWSQCISCNQTFTADATITPSANNQVICITGGTNYSFTSTFSNVTVKICAPGVTISTFRVMTGALNNKVEVYSENVLFSNILIDADTFKFSTYSSNTQILQTTLNRKTVFTAKSQSSLSILGALAPGDRIFINAEQGATINTKGLTSNNGGIITIAKDAVINVDGVLHFQNYGTLINYNKLNVTGDLYIQGDSQNAVVNRCGESEVNVSGQLFINQGLFYNAGVVIADRITINSNAGPIYPNNGAVLEARTLLVTNNTANIIRADSLDPGACAMFKTPDYTAWNAPITNSSQINYCGRAATVAQLGSATVSCTCPTPRQVCVPVCVAPTSVSISAPFQQVCQGVSVVLTGDVFGINPTHSYTYKWYLNSVTPANLISNPTNASSISVSISGSYYLVVSDNANPALCTTTSLPFVFTVNPIPPQPTVASSGPITFCDGGSVLLTASVNGFTGGTYTWSTGSHSNPLSVTTSGSYTVTYVSAANCTAPTSAETTVTVNPIPPQPTVAASGPLTFCDGGSVSLTASVTGFSGGTYTWSTGSHSNPLSVTTSGSYTVTYVSAANCTAPTSAATTVTVNPIPPQPTVAASGPLTFCDGGNVTLTATVNGFNGGSYQWSTGASSTSIVVSTSGKYGVVYTSNESCVSPVSDSTTVTAYPTPEVPIVSYSGNLGICPGDSVVAKINRLLPDGIFEWYNEQQTILSSLDSITIKAAGVYSVRFVSNESCVSPKTIPFAVSMLPFNTVVVAGADKVICNSTIVLSGNTPLSGVGIWSVSALSAPISIASTDGSNATVKDLIYRNTYEFVYTIEGAACGAPSRDTIKVAIGLPNFSLTGLQVPKDTLCVGVSRQVSVQATGGSGNYKYTWVNTANQSKTVTTINTYEITPQFKSSDWYVYVEDKNNTGCLTDTLPIHISALEKQNLFFQIC